MAAAMPTGRSRRRGTRRRSRSKTEPLFRHGLGADRGAHLGAFFAGRAEAEQRAGQGAELGDLFDVRDLELLHGAVLELAHEEQVDEAHDVGLLQAPQLLEGGALELGVLAEAHDQDLYRTHMPFLSVSLGRAGPASAARQHLGLGGVELLLR